MKKHLFLCLILCLETTNAASINNFSGGYDVSNWSQSLNGGTIDTSGAPNSIIETSSNLDPGFMTNNKSADTDFTIASLGSGLVNFGWLYNTSDWDSSYDPFGSLLNGVFTQITVDGISTSQSGAASFNVLAGEVFGFRAHSIDSAFGAATTTISNFSAPAAVPVPAAVWLFGSGLMGLIAMRKKPSHLSALPA